MNKPGKPLRPTTLSTRLLARQAKREGSTGLHVINDSGSRPATRGDCRSTMRPCAYMSCKYHLYLDIVGKGTIKFNAPGDVFDMWESCVLDIAERGGATLEEISEYMNITRERVRQIQVSALSSLNGQGDPKIEEDL